MRVFLLGVLFSLEAQGALLKNIFKVKGVRENILVGYGLVVGLKGTGDSSADVTNKSLSRMFQKLGLSITAEVQSNNVASVVITAKLPPFARAGQKIDVTISSVGDASSLEGGMLLATPLRAGDQKVYAVAQGLLSLGSVADGSSLFPTVARVPGGALVERERKDTFAKKRGLRLHMEESDFTTVARAARIINTELGGKYATAIDGNTIDLVIPFSFKGNTVELMAVLENLTVDRGEKAKIVVNERTGTVVAGGSVRIKSVALSHGDLSIHVESGLHRKKEKGKKFVKIQASSNVSELVKALNIIGVAPKDLTAIFQALKKAGALEGELEIF